MLMPRLSSLGSWPAGLRELDEMRREMDRFFGPLTGAARRTAGVFPAINVTESDEALQVRTELPGIKVSDLDITVENDTLMLAGSRIIELEEDNVSYHRRERQFGTFRRSLTLPVRVDANQGEASYRNGILTIVLPKAVEVRPRRINVEEVQS